MPFTVARCTPRSTPRLGANPSNSRSLNDPPGLDLRYASMADEKPYFSNTQFDMLFKCPESFRRRYVEGEKRPPGIALMTGTAVHSGAGLNFRQKIHSHADLPVRDIVEASVEAFNASKAGGFMLTEEEESKGVRGVLGEAKDHVAQLALVHATQVAPEYQPTFVEERVRLELLNSPRDLLGVLDLADDQGRVVDHKTTGKRKNQKEADESTQLTIYSAAHRVLTGQPAKEVRLEVLIKGNTERSAERQLIRSTRGREDYETLANRFNVALKLVEAGIFAPAPVGAWWCAQKFCGFYQTCCYVQQSPKQIYDLYVPGQEPAATPAGVTAAATGDPAGEPFGETTEIPDMPAPKGPGIKGVRFGSKKERMFADSQRCKWCEKMLSLKTAVIDFIVPKIHGGGSNEENLCIACVECSRTRANTGLRPEDVTAETTAITASTESDS